MLTFRKAWWIPSLALALLGASCSSSTLDTGTEATAEVARAATAPCELGQECCPSGYTTITLTNDADVFSSSQAKQCIRALGASDTIAANVGPSVVLAGDGSDTVMAGPNAVVRGGAGDDTINAWGGTAIVYGGSGNDTMMAANGKNFVAPGSGNDRAFGGVDNDTFAIFDRCEITPGGKNLDGGGGFNTLFTPVPLAELRQLGVTATNFQAVIVEPQSCRSDCGASPQCADVDCAAANKEHAFVRKLPNGDVRFSITLPSAQQSVKLLARRNGEFLVESDLVKSGVADTSGRITYSKTFHSSRFLHGDEIIARFATRTAGGSTVFHPGPEEQIWSSVFRYLKLIDEVRFSKTEVCPNEPVTVSVRANPALPGGSTSVSIGNVPGAERDLQFSGAPGPRRVAITVQSGCFTDSDLVELRVVDCPGAVKFVHIKPSASLLQPDTTEFLVTDAPDFGPDARYTWDFGDGAVETGGFRATQHHYGPPSASSGLVRTFVASVRVEKAGVVVATGRTSVSLTNEYARDKARGLIRPPARVTRGLAQPTAGGSFQGTIQVTNLEPVALTYRQRWAEPVPCSPGAPVPAVQQTAVDVRVPANAAGTLDVALDPGLLTANVCAVGVRYVGTSDGRRTETTSFFDVRRVPFTTAVANPTKLAALGHAIDNGLVADVYNIKDSELRALARAGRLPFSETDIDPEVLPGAPPPASPAGPIATGPDLGDPCEPTDPPPRPGLSCQLARKPDGTYEGFLMRPALLLNARKGDAVLSQGCSPIAGMLISIGKRYEHVGIMTEDHRHIRHAFFSLPFTKRNPASSTTELCAQVKIAAGFPPRMDNLCREVRAGKTVVNAKTTANVLRVCDELTARSAETAAEIVDLKARLPRLFGQERAQAEKRLAELEALAAQGEFACDLLPHGPTVGSASHNLCVTVNGCGSIPNATDGFDERAVRFGWPGTVTQSIDDAFVDGYLAGPDGRSYVVHPFNSRPSYCGDASRPLADPLVLRPTPETEAATRPRLHQAADKAEALPSGPFNGHYRFFAYTKGDIVQDLSRSPTSNLIWPGSVGTYPVMCSSFVWRAITEAGFTLRNGLPVAGVPAGMFLYSERDRKTAANFLYSTVYDMVQGAAPNTAFLVDAADDTANQFTNCFASDLCTPGDWSFLGETGADSDAWRSPGAGVTVAPDDLRDWAPSTAGGPYGQEERLFFRDREYHPLSRWQAAPGTGTLQGRVVGDDPGRTPIPAVTVQILTITRETPADGTFDFGPLPAGEYSLDVKAPALGVAKTIHGVKVLPDQQNFVEIVLSRPRSITIAGATYTKDGETFEPDIIRRQLVSEKLEVSSTRTQEKKNTRTDCVGDEVDMRLDYTADYQTDPNLPEGTVKVTIVLSLFENSECLTDEREDTATATVTLGPDQQTDVHLTVVNRDGSPNPDRGEVELIVVNGAFFHQGEPTADVRYQGNMHVLDHDTFSPNETGDFPFDQRKTLSPNQRAQAMNPVQGTVDDEVTGRFQAMAVLQANNRDIRLYTIQHILPTAACESDGHWIDNVSHGTPATFRRQVGACSNEVTTTFTVTYPFP